MAALFNPSLAGKAIRGVLVAGAAAAALMAFGVISNQAGAVTPLAPPARMPVPAVDAPRTGALQTAVLSGGCFWGVQGVFEHVKGVKQVLAGYAGGAAATANYELVSTGTTGHAESVQIVFDPAQISYGQILQLFFSVATDPTQTGGQYPDVGSQYRTEVWYVNDAQRNVATRYVAQLNAAHVFRHPIATRVDPYKGFFPAEAYHQNYLELHPEQPYIAAYDIPKVQALKALFPADWRGAPVLASR
ncbi:MAG TPA: peptide-methionine (S)-S-oxide reductase MsrA [Caulobacteraceae bacterium]|jgi:peptide-methionine (S)-S-oxide reductase|nr:peptide-methionine (S)-S-oxide reductase MsrA [Caulobacteraceae bacterium]